MESESPPHIAIVPSPGMGHLIPLLEFAKLLSARFGFSISLLLPAAAASEPSRAQLDLLGSLPGRISYTFLPPPDPSLLPPPGAAHEAIITVVLAHSLPYVRSSLSSLRPAALVTDIFGTAFFSVARELGVPPYMYFTSTAMCLLFLFNLPRLHETVSCEYRDLADPLVLPGCVPLHGRDFVDPVQDRRDEAYDMLVEHTKRYSLAEGIFVNTFMDSEPGAIQGLRAEDPARPPIYPIGPITRSGSSGGAEGCLKWLDRQPAGSVLFVSFGSGGTLSYEQIDELAIGLERSRVRFLWVVRGPNENSSSGSFFRVQDDDDPFGFLPKGFVDRVKDRGLLVPSWAPQVEILAHGSTGGFLTHCGWNSTLESIVNGVPLIAWPLYAEQRMNAVMLEEGLEVALRPSEARGGGLVGADEIARVVKELMKGEEGKRVRVRMRELGEAAHKAIGEEGDSTKVLREVVLKWGGSKQKSGTRNEAS